MSTRNYENLSLLIKNKYEERLRQYNQSPKLCLQCSAPLPYKEHKRKKFCNHSCAAVYNNQGVCRNGTKRDNCLFCGESLKNKESKKYCSHQCRISFKEQELINNWIINDIINIKCIANAYRRYLLKQADYKCSMCGWNKKHPISGRIPLTIDHIDGNPHNHSFKNLRVLCPNCHSLTETYGIYNKGNGRKDRYKKTV